MVMELGTMSQSEFVGTFVNFSEASPTEEFSNLDVIKGDISTARE